MGVHFGSSSPWRAHVFSTRVSAWRLPFKADSRGNFMSHRFSLELNFLIAGFEEFTSTIIIDCVRNGTLGQGLRGSTPLSCHAHSCRAFRIAIAPRQTLYKFVYRGLPIFLVRLSDHPRYLIRGTIRVFVTSWVAMLIFVFLRLAEPYSGLLGKVSISCIAPFPSAGRV